MIENNVTTALVDDCDLNVRFDNNIGNEDFDKLVDTGTEAIVSDKECLDEGVKENNENEVGTENNNKVSSIEIDKNVMDVNDHNEIEGSNMQSEPVKTYANVIKKSESFDSNKLKINPTEINELGEEVVAFDEEMVKIDGSKLLGIVSYERLSYVVIVFELSQEVSSIALNWR
ncbi:hypothetical protein Tco_1072132, partial [Tanacetum coccineum]